MGGDLSGVCVGLDWSDADNPMMRMAPARAGDMEVLVPLFGGLRFRLARPGSRYCCGWFDYSGAESRHQRCPSQAKVTSGRQCLRCQSREGFVPVHQSHRSDAELPESVRAYMAQPHWLYLSVFADGSLKVGTVSQARFRGRLSEQGPIAACYVGQADNGIDIRRAEAEVSAKLGFGQAVSSKRKLAAVDKRIDVAARIAELDEATGNVRSFLRDLAAATGWARPTDPMPRWEMPLVARALMDATPLTRYPEDLTAGEHSLFITGANGPVAAFTVRADPEADLYAADLTALRGAYLAFGEFSSTVGAVQPALF